MANEAIEVLVGLRVRHREGGPGVARQTDALGRKSARTFDARYHSAVCRRARPTAVEPHGVRAIRGAAVGGIWGFASRDLSEFALIYVLVQGLAVRPRLG